MLKIKKTIAERKGRICKKTSKKLIARSRGEVLNLMLMQRDMIGIRAQFFAGFVHDHDQVQR